MDVVEQKEESILMVDAESDPQLPSPSPALLRNESAFIVCSDIESEEEMNQVLSERETPRCLDHNALSSSTQFELSSRPTTAVPMDAIRQFGDRIMASSQNRKSLDHNRANPVEVDRSEISNIVNLSYSTFTVPDDEEDDHDPFAVHVVVEDSMQCVSPPMDCSTNMNAVNDSILTVHEVVSDHDDDGHGNRNEMPSLERDQESVGDEDEENGNGKRSGNGDEEEEWKQINKVDRDNVASLRSAFAELSGDKEEEFAVNEVDGDHGVRTPPQKMVEEFAVKEVERKEEDEESEVEYEEDFEDPEQEEVASEAGGDSKQRAVFRLPELDSSINTFQSKLYSVYSSFDDTLMTHSVASSSDLGQVSPQQLRTVCKTICE